jgi:hypothetical protein
MYGRLIETARAMKGVNMSRLIYEQSVSYEGYLIVPFVFGKADNYEIYSYKLLSELGSKSRFHKKDNPAQIYGNSTDNILQIAKEHIDNNLEFVSQGDYFKSRYIYKHNLIIVFQEGGKYFYDHYAPDSLNNIAAPRIFKSEYDCLNWIREGLQERYIRQKAS